MQDRIAPYLVALYQAVIIVAFAAIAILAYRWFHTPFIGAFLEHTLVFNAMEPTRPGTWNAKNLGLDFGHQLISIDGQDIRSVREYIDKLETYAVGDVVALSVLTPEGEIRDVEITLQRFPTPDRMAFMVIPYCIGLIYLISGLWVLSLRRADSSGRSFALLTASVAISTAGLFEISTTNYLTYIWTFSLAMGGGALINLALVFPQEARWMKRWPYLSWIGYVITLLLTIAAFPTLYDYDNPLAYIVSWRVEYIFLGAAALVFMSLTLIRRYKSTFPIVRQQGVAIMWGAILSFTPITIWFFGTATRPDMAFSIYLLLPLAIFPIAVGYAILRYRLINTDYLFSRAVLYALLTIIVVGGYALLVGGMSLVLGSVLTATNPYLIGMLVFLLAVFLNPVRTGLQSLVDTVFFKGQKVYRDRIQSFNQELNPVMELSTILDLLRQYVERSLMPTQLHIFVHDSVRDHFVATPDETERPTSDIRFAANSALPQMLASRNTFIFLGDDTELPSDLQPEKARIALLGAQLFIPLPGRSDKVIGFMALAPRLSGEPFTSMDLNLLTSLSDQAAMSVERAQVVADLERRVHEMNVLIRVAQGINITLRFDDILELIYAQANRLIPSRDFWIMLYDDAADNFHYAFYLEDDKRLLKHEHRPLIGEQYLSQAIVRSRRPIVADDYERECRKRGIEPQVDGLYAWVGVPLNAGAVTFGAMSMGSRDPSTVYSSEQVELLQAIADQTAGAIVKTRLLEESERSARQLRLLNEVGRNLTSTLDLPNLLDQILDSAVEIINCEAGTLFLVDEDTGELVFEVVKGPVAEELVGRRLPPGTGHVGKTIETRSPAIVNAACNTTEWAKNPDKQTGFKTRDLLLIPMFVKDSVVGVIEAINRCDGLPFTKDDQDLLTTFTSQAAIALENARLYTLTDQKLADRVDELSVMQRIDRELNASLEINRAMNITLDWAMRRSEADAGLVGSVDDDGLHVVVHQGYAAELDPYRDSPLPIELPALQKAIEDEKTQQFSRSSLNVEIGVDDYCLLEDAQRQIVIPIRREAQVIGILMLECRRDEPWSSDIQEFLSRLSDHAAIAISNAQLFTQVQAADIAKSDFVSLVSHELKTPMTSIRGYTDLLLGGAVGPVNEAQVNFLGTVRSNVNRMATLVSDLADISRIEAGRLRLEFEAFDISDIVDEVSRSQGQSFKEKEQPLDLQIPDDLPQVWGDRTRIVQVLTNLVSNANKYTPQGGIITIKAEHTTNRWDPDGAPDVLCVAVKDNGIGMTPEDQEQIFTKFFRSEDQKARESPGTGLGLNITRYIVEIQGGKIWFESEYRKGTTFYFTIPIAEV